MRTWLLFPVVGVVLTFCVAAAIYLFFPFSTQTPVAIESDQEQKDAGLAPLLNPDLLSWTAAATSSPWEARDSHSSFVFKGKLWLIGGLNGNGHTTCSSTKCTTRYWEAMHFNDIWSSSDGAHWTLEKAHAAFPPRRSASIIAFQDKLWMFGGYSPEGGLQSDIWQSTDGIHWKEVTTHAGFLAREGQSVEVWNGKLWMFGGVNYDQRKELNDVWYSDNGIDWTLATEHAPWKPRWDHDTEIFNGKMYLASGMDLTLEAMNDVWVTEDGVNWAQVMEHAPWKPRQGGALVAHRGFLWIIGRLNDRDDGYGPNDVWYTADGVTWQKTITDPGWVGREDESILELNNRIYVFGGMGAVGEGIVWQNDVWVSSE